MPKVPSTILSRGLYTFLDILFGLVRPRLTCSYIVADLLSFYHVLTHVPWTLFHGLSSSPNYIIYLTGYYVDILLFCCIIHLIL